MKCTECFLFFILILTPFVHGQRSDLFLPWQEGYLDIHHINTARGNATFFLFPDGTTLLFDAGAKKIPAHKMQEYFPAAPTDSLSAGGWIAYYIKKIIPPPLTPQIDYAVISHFHNDHYGQIDSTSTKSSRFSYFLSGITEVGDVLPIKTLIDRGYPKYDYPVDLKAFYKNDVTFHNYLIFIEEQKIKNGLIAEKLLPGSNSQIRLLKNEKKYSHFTVRNIKSNTEIWSGEKNNTLTYALQLPLVNGDDLDENALCIALKISYGQFDYYTGGDINGYTEWGGVDMETTVAQSVGEVEALALDHHGYYDATNAALLKMMNPQVAIHQVIHDPHFQPSVLNRLLGYPVDIFTYNLHEKVKQTFDPAILQKYKSTKGHILLRVYPGGKEYTIHILDDTSATLKQISQFGPYHSHEK